MSVKPTQHKADPTRMYGEPRWPAALATVCALALYATLPERLLVGPAWLVPVFELALIVPLVIASPRRYYGEPRWQRITPLVLIAVISLANVFSLVLLLDALLTGGSKATGKSLLLASIQIWLTNVIVFALWYWELDRGGPDERIFANKHIPDFLFPQMVTPSAAAPLWHPTFVDYFYVSFTNATAFSPTDTMPLTPRAKMLMAVQALASLLTVAFVAARAVNILS